MFLFPMKVVGINLLATGKPSHVHHSLALMQMGIRTHYTNTLETPCAYFKMHSEGICLVFSFMAHIASY